LKIEPDGLANRIAESYGTEREAACYVVPGALDTLTNLRAQGIKLALVTNGAAEGQQRKVERFRLTDYFDYIQIEGRYGIGKPDARVFRNVLRKLDVKAADAWMVGDNLEFDIRGGRNAGLYTVWVDWQDKGETIPEDSRPDRIIKNISELKDLIS
jgi:putative hydrolase of the HAD superfamily